MLKFRVARLAGVTEHSLRVSGWVKKRECNARTLAESAFLFPLQWGLLRIPSNSWLIFSYSLSTYFERGEELEAKGVDTGELELYEGGSSVQLGEGSRVILVRVIFALKSLWFWRVILKIKIIKNLCFLREDRKIWAVKWGKDRENLDWEVCSEDVY